MKQWLYVHATTIGTVIARWGFRKLGLRFVGYRVSRHPSGNGIVIGEIRREPATALRASMAEFN